MLKRFYSLPAAALAAAVTLGGSPSAAEDFDYFVLALSWSPTWCAADPERRDADQCHPDRDLGFSLHGLWPQYENGGWPEYCRTGERDPSRGQTAAMADIMGSGGLAWYQWKKHGRCSGLSAQDYFETSRFAYSLTELPEIGWLTTSEDLTDAFVAANPDLEADNMIVTCRGDRLREVRICLTPGLQPRRCSREVLEDACRHRGPLDAPEPP